MNPWTALLESLHSALIDELCERHPEPKPELGMPVRKPRFELPDPSLMLVVACEVEQAGTRGAGFIAMNSECSKMLGIQPRELWEACMKRAGMHFARRQIKPHIARVVELGGATLPPDFPELQRVIWIPVKFPSGSCFFGIGV